MAVSRVPPIVSVPQGASPEVASAFRQLNVLLQTTNDRLDALEGLRGSPTMNAALNMRGNPIHDVGSPSLPGDVVTLGYLQGTAAAQAPASPAATGIPPGSIGTWNIQSSAVTVSGLFANDASVSFPNTNAEVEIGTLTITTNGGTVFILGKTTVEISASSPGQDKPLIRLRKGSLTGTILDSAMFLMAIGYSQIVTVTLIGMDNSPARAQTYKLTAQGQSGEGGFCYYRRLFPMNAKR
jgi:hypothetical protein